MKAEEILSFWFKEATPEQQFKKDPTFDALILKRFSHTLEAARNGELWAWRTTLHGRLAEIIVLDQFSRNIYRDDPKSFRARPYGLSPGPRGRCGRKIAA